MPPLSRLLPPSSAALDGCARDGRSPPEFLQIQPSSLVELDAFGLEQVSLQLVPVAACPLADFAARIDHAMPRQLHRAGQGVQGVSDLARVTIEPGQAGDLTVGGDAATGNLPDDGVDSQVMIRHSTAQILVHFIYVR